MCEKIHQFQSSIKRDWFLLSASQCMTKIIFVCVFCVFVCKAEKQLELQLFRLFHNEREIDEMNTELAHKSQTLDKENRRLQKIEDEMRERKKEHGKLMKDISKLEQQLKDSV